MLSNTRTSGESGAKSVEKRSRPFTSIRSEHKRRQRQINDNLRLERRGLGPNKPIILSADPDLFLTRPKGGHKGVRELLEETMPGHRDDVHNYRRLSEDHDVIVEVDPEKTIHSEWSTTRVLFRIDRGYDLRKQNLVDEAFQRVLDVKPKHARTATPEEVRSNTEPSWHWGVWCRSCDQPHISCESRLRVQRPKKGEKKRATDGGTQDDPLAILAIDHLLAVLNELVGSSAMKILHRYCPKVAQERDRIIESIWQHRALKHWLVNRPALHSSAWTCVAVKKGAAEVDHIDIWDHINQFTVIATAGTYTGGDVVIPQLRLRIPLRPGQLLFLRTRYLAHYIMPFQGDRYVMAGFMDHNLCQQYGPKNIDAPKDLREHGEIPDPRRCDMVDLPPKKKARME